MARAGKGATDDDASMTPSTPTRLQPYRRASEVLRNCDTIIFAVYAIIDEGDVVRLVSGRRQRRRRAARPAHIGGPSHGARTCRVLLDDKDVTRTVNRVRESRRRPVAGQYDRLDIALAPVDG